MEKITNNNQQILPEQFVILRKCVLQALHNYFSNMGDHKPVDLYSLVLREVELPLLQAVLEYSEGNKSKAANILGLNRVTLRKKLKQHQLKKK